MRCFAFTYPTAYPRASHSVVDFIQSALQLVTLFFCLLPAVGPPPSPEPSSSNITYFIQYNTSGIEPLPCGAFNTSSGRWEEQPLGQRYGAPGNNSRDGARGGSSALPHATCLSFLPCRTGLVLLCFQTYIILWLPPFTRADANGTAVFPSAAVQQLAGRLCSQPSAFGAQLAALVDAQDLRTQDWVQALLSAQCPPAATQALQRAFEVHRLSPGGLSAVLK